MEEPMMGWYGDGGWWSAGMALMTVFWVVVAAGIIWAAVRLVRRPTEIYPAHESARQVLDHRFASGELDEQGYARARRVLEGHAVDSGSA
jgi:putative membrane protein